MPGTALKVLHVEDDVDSQELIASHLRGMDDFDITVVVAESEKMATEAVAAGDVDLIVVNYELNGGNALQCVERIRTIDPMIPILVLSATVNSRVAGELLRAGADDFVRKDGLTKEDLAAIIGDMLTRSSLLRLRQTSGQKSWDQTIDNEFREICRVFLSTAGEQFFKRLDAFEFNVRRRQITAEQFQRVFETTCTELANERPSGSPPIKRMLRPIMLELLLRLFDTSTVEKHTSQIT